jgi:hypothetical protein
LVLFMYGVTTGNSAVIESVLLVALRFWIVLTTLVTLLFILYYIVILPKLLELSKKS